MTPMRGLMYAPTTKELAKARKILAAPTPGKWTPAKAKAHRWAGMVVDSFNRVSDAWLYWNELSGAWKGPMSEEEKAEGMWARIDRVNNFPHTEELREAA